MATPTFAKAPPEDVGPYLSLNPKVTEPSKLGVEPTQEALEKMKSVDPKLECKWVIWEQHKQSKDKKAEYADATRKTVTFGTVKEFWACWNHLPQPSELLDNKKFVRSTNGSQSIIDSLMIFREGVAPEWEDPANASGGHFQLALKPQVGGGIVDELWNNVVLGMVSGAIQPAEMITGARLVDKLDGKGNKSMLRIELWFSDFDEESASGGTGKVYDLRGSFERCMRIGLDGNEKPVTWGRTETKSHK
mmetsp:Transcript_94382/g.236927  ORF Transcript_94382/g.236927 Transcript_94382/m.236927 type:complete len:248 (-) Transcript_94382:51-794(-)